MSLLMSINFQAPLSICCKVLPTGSLNVSTPKDESYKVATRLNFMQQNTRDSFRRLWVYPKYNQVSRLQVSVVTQHVDHPIYSVPVPVARELLHVGHYCLDVRTKEEYYVGHIEGAINIPYLVKMGPGLSKNYKFMEEVVATFCKEDEIIVGMDCNSDRRLMMAVVELVAEGFTGITNMGGGFQAWKKNGLPTMSAEEEEASRWRAKPIRVLITCGWSNGMEN